MIIDNNFAFSTNQAMTTTCYSDIVDLGADGLGKGSQVKIYCSVSEDFTGGNAFDIVLQTGDQPDLSDAVNLCTCGARSVGVLKKGVDLGFNSLPNAMKRYARLWYFCDGTFATGKVTAGVALDTQTNR